MLIAAHSPAKKRGRLCTWCGAGCKMVNDGDHTCDDRHHRHVCLRLAEIKIRQGKKSDKNFKQSHAELVSQKSKVLDQLGRSEQSWDQEEQAEEDQVQLEMDSRVAIQVEWERRSNRSAIQELIFMEDELQHVGSTRYLQ